MQNTIYPPYLDTVLENCPQAGHLYTICWREKAFDNSLIYDKEKVTNEHSIPWKKFKNDLRLLQKEKVLKFSINATNDKAVVKFSESENATIIPFNK